MRHLDLFSGIGGFALSAQWVWGEQHEIISFCEIDPFCQKVLKKHWPDVPCCEDIKKLTWVLNENDIPSQHKVCEQKNNEPRICETLDSQSTRKEKSQLSSNVSSVEHPLFFVHPKQKGAVDSALINADMGLCGEALGQTPAAGNGCEESVIQTGKVGTDTKEVAAIKKQKSISGEEGFLQGTDMYANCAVSNPRKKGNLTPTILKSGQSTRSCDSKFQTDKHYAKNVTKGFTGKGRVDLLTAGVPCQPASCAGKRRGKDDDRWLWGETYRVIRDCKPRWVILENVKGLLSLEQGVVFEDLLLELENIGYEVQPVIIPACAVNAPHRRDRVWIIANSNSKRLQGRKEAGDTGEGLPEREQQLVRQNPEWNQDWLEVATRLCTVDDGIPRGLVRPKGWRVNALKAAGNAIVPQVAAEIMRAIKDIEPEESNAE